MKLCIIVWVFISVALMGQHAMSQKLSQGPQVVTFFSDADDTEQPYGLYIPKNYDAQKKYPLVIMLHGAGSNHRLALRRVFGKSNAPGETDVEASRYFPEWKDVEYIVASPYARGTAGYQGIAEKDVYDVLEDVKKRFNIDEDRTYLTGLSMGGGGTLWIGLTRPDIWAAIAPVCAAPPPATVNFLPNGTNLPAYIFHGDADPVVPVQWSRDWARRLKELGTHVEYTEYPDVQHDSWVNAYADGFIFTWFDKFKRNRFPDEVRLASDQYKYSKAYWVSMDQLTPGIYASIHVKWSQSTQLDITTSSLGAFTLTLEGHPKYKAGQALQITIDGKKLKATASPSLSLTNKDGKWVIGKFDGGSNSKKSGAEGPVSNAFGERHIYVYGTGGNPSEQEMRERISTANQAAEWSIYRGDFLGRIMFFPRVIADKDVRPSDLESANLVLFGTKETNSLIEKFGTQLPIQLNVSGSKEYGLFYIYPQNNRYVVINSGLPWWTGVQPQGFPFLPASIQVLSEIKDFILFKGAIKDVVAEGFFNHTWQLNEGDVKKLRDTGVVTLR